MSVWICLALLLVTIGLLVDMFMANRCFAFQRHALFNKISTMYHQKIFFKVCKLERSTPDLVAFTTNNTEVIIIIMNNSIMRVIMHVDNHGRISYDSDKSIHMCVEDFRLLMHTLSEIESQY